MIPENVNELLLIDQYYCYYNEYKTKYPNVVVMFQKGNHYNFFSVFDDPTNFDKVSFDMNLTATFQSGDNDVKGTKKNPAMCGFPIIAKYKYVDRFIKFDYTVVEVAEVKSKKGLQKGEFREVVNIYTKSTWVPEISDDVHVVQIYVEFPKSKFKAMAVGLSSINLSTGDVVIYEAYNNPDDTNYAYDEINRFICSHSPQEIFCNSDNKEFQKYSPKENPFENDEHIDNFLEKVYSPGMVKIDNYLGTEMYQYAKKSLGLLLHHIYSHNRNLLKNPHLPTMWSLKKFMFLANNSVTQLDVVGNSKCLLNLIDHTCTKMGGRLLRYRLINPITDATEIERRYSEVESIDKDLSVDLKKIGDVDVWIRRVECGTITPAQTFKLVESLKKSVEILVSRGTEALGKYVSKIDVILQNGYKTVEENFFREGYDEELDGYVSTIESIHSKFTRLMDPKLLLKLEKLDVGYYFKITDAKYKLLDKEVETITVGKNKYIRFPKMKEYDEKLQVTEKALAIHLKTVYDKFIKSLDVVKIKDIAMKIAEVDVYNSCKIVADRFKYCRPVICDGEGYISATSMRHPIIERVSDSLYVPNDVKIHKEKGILIYGVNSSGKSSIMKSLGLNLIMAQAGMYVAATSWKYTIFDNLQTRILGNDDMYNGQSSYAVEMLELKGIMAKAGPRSIVFGDEICRGTESVSGTAIAATAIIELLKLRTCFVFTTHLHDIVEIPEIKDLQNLGIYHMKVQHEDGNTIFNRILEKGSGDTLYGLEIAAAMGLPQTFIEKAHAIRRSLVKENIIGKKSRYNSRFFIDRCELCGEVAVDTHHINHQKDAGIDGCIDHYHKNKIGNLVGLCKKCHVDVHKGVKSVVKKVDSIDGIILK